MSEDFEALEDAFEKHAERHSKRRGKAPVSRKKTAGRAKSARSQSRLYGLLGVLLGGVLLVGAGFWLAKLPPTTLTSGSTAPDFQLPTIDGQMLQLSALRGRVVLLAFWSSNCATCQREMAALQTLYQTYRERGVLVVGVNIGDDIATIDALLPNSPYPNVLDTDGKVYAEYGVTDLPTSFIISPRGVITTIISGEILPNAVAATLNTLLTESAP
jgi:peroxiredoxin